MRCGEIFRTGRSGGASQGGWSGQKNHHKCVWNREKIQMVRCTETYGQGPCYFGAATCLTHEAVSNTPKELLDWLKKRNIQSTMFTVQCGQVSGPKKMLTKSETSTHESLKITEAERMKWSQTGELVWPQMDDQLADQISGK